MGRPLKQDLEDLYGYRMSEDDQRRLRAIYHVGVGVLVGMIAGSAAYAVYVVYS